MVSHELPLLYNRGVMVLELCFHEKFSNAGRFFIQTPIAGYA